MTRALLSEPSPRRRPQLLWRKLLRWLGLWRLPSDFDWRAYLDHHPDLRAAGLANERQSARHWWDHGELEGRVHRGPRRPAPGWDWASRVDRFDDSDVQAADGTPRFRDPPEPKRPPKVAMVCPSVDSIFLRASGDLTCWDDAGSEHVLQAWDHAVDYGQIYLHGPYEEIRRRLYDHQMPRPRDCGRCLLLRSRGIHSSAPVDERFVRILRVEPSYLCTLDCPGCVPLSARPRNRQAGTLPLEVFERLLSGLRRSEIEVYAIDFQGHGEPLLNPELRKMIGLGRARYPAAWITMTTNAHARLRTELLTSGLDEIVCAIDGVDGESYASYRVNGRFDLAWRFLSDVAIAASRAPRPGYE